MEVHIRYWRGFSLVLEAGINALGRRDNGGGLWVRGGGGGRGLVTKTLDGDLLFCCIHMQTTPRQINGGALSVKPK